MGPPFRGALFFWGSNIDIAGEARRSWADMQDDGHWPQCFLGETKKLETGCVCSHGISLETCFLMFLVDVGRFHLKDVFFVDQA